MIRKATADDFKSLYRLGLATPEFRVGADGNFMEEDEFLSAIENPNGTFLLAEVDGAVTGFIYASRYDIERGPRTHWACLVYLVVSPERRKQGVAQLLYDACIGELQLQGVTNVYVWANIESDGSIVQFLKKQGLVPGHKYLWMDKRIGGTIV